MMPTVKLIQEAYKNAKILESVRGNKFNMEDYDISSIKHQGKEIFIIGKDGLPDRCLYDHDTETRAIIIE